MAKKIKRTTELVCPACDSGNVAVTAEQKFMVNTGDHYCFSVKEYDHEAKADCLDCSWDGRRDQLIQHFHESKK